MASRCTTTLLLLTFATLLFFRSCSSHSNHDFHECLIDELEKSNSQTDVIYTANNASFESLLTSEYQRPASNSLLKPLLIIAPHHVSQIQAAVYCSKKVGIQIRVRSGGHDLEGLSNYASKNPFVVVDMRNIRSVSVNTKKKTAWVQVGATLGQLYYTVAKHSRTLAFPAGVCPTVGVGGHFSGGGYGMMSRAHGLAADKVIDAQFINADGQLLDRKSMGEDLFWAIRGGGGTSFGIVVAFKVKLVTVPENVTIFYVFRTLEQNATQLIHKWQYIADKVDDNLLLRLFFSSSPTTGGTGNRTTLANSVTLFLGRARDLAPQMQEKFPELGLVQEDYTEMSWIESVRYFADLQNKSLDSSRDPLSTYNFKGKSDYATKPIPIDGWSGIWKFLHEGDESVTLTGVMFSPYGGELNAYSESETPFPHRSGNLFMIEYMVVWTNNESKWYMDWIRRLYSFMTPYVSKSPRRAYVNYRDLEIGMNNIEGNTSYEQASIWGRKYFKDNFHRLVRVKTKVDPSNFFRNEQSIPPLSA